MKDSEKYDALSHLRELLSLQELPTLRQTGLPGNTIHQIYTEGLIELASDESVPVENQEDRHSVFRITPKAEQWMICYERAEAARKETLVGIFLSNWRHKLVEAVWGLIGLIGGAILGWHLHRLFGDS